MMVKSVATVVLSLVVMSSSVHARAYIGWGNNSHTLVRNDDRTEEYLPIGSSSLFQLIWAPSGEIHNGIMPGGDPTGDNVLLDSFVLDSTTLSTSYGFTDPAEWDSNDNPGLLDVGGQFFTRIFETEDPQAGDWYYNGQLETATSRSLTDPPQSYYNPVRDTYSDTGPTADMTGDTIDDPNSDFNFQVVPEPGTIAMVALGIATLGGAAHKKRKNAVVEG